MPVEARPADGCRRGTISPFVRGVCESDQIQYMVVNAVVVIKETVSDVEDGNWRSPPHLFFWGFVWAEDYSITQLVTTRKNIERIFCICNMYQAYSSPFV